MSRWKPAASSLHMTLDAEWSPQTVGIDGNRECREASLAIGAVTRENKRRRLAAAEVETDTVLERVNGALVHDLLVERMISSMKVRADDARTRKSRLHKQRCVNTEPLKRVSEQLSTQCLAST